MANDELKHSTYIHDFAVADIEELNKVYKPSAEMQERWDKAHSGNVEKAALIKHMLTL